MLHFYHRKHSTTLSIELHLHEKDTDFKIHCHFILGKLIKDFKIDSRFSIRPFEERGLFREAFDVMLLLNSSLTVIPKSVKTHWEENRKKRRLYCQSI